MTDKQIIIDGVNVAECVYRAEGKCILKDDECYSFPNCDYKQLKRKEYKLDKIKETINYYSGIHCSKCKHYKTCTSIDDCINTITKELLQIIEDKDNDSILTTLSTLVKNNIKLRETLAEIKKIAEKAAKCLYTTESDDYTDGYRWLGSLILQKIRKCEVENERILSEE